MHFILNYTALGSTLLLFCIQLRALAYSQHMKVTQGLVYPEVRRNTSVIDDYHGTQITDPYRWLEDLDSIETKAFVAQQKQLTKNYLENISVREPIRQMLTELVNYEKYMSPISLNQRHFYLYNSGLQNHDVWMVKDSGQQPRTLLDPNELSEDGSISLGYYYAFSNDGESFVYTLSEGGSDWLTAHFKNVSTGENYPEMLQHMRWPEFSWTIDGLGVFYGRFPLDEDGLPISENTQIYYHRLGEDQSMDTFVTENAENPQWFLFAQVSVCGKYLIVERRPDFKSDGILIAALTNDSHSYSDLEFIPVFSADLNARFIYVTNEDTTFTFLSDYKAPNFQLIQVTIDLQQKNYVMTTVLVPEHEKNILKWALPFLKDKLVLCYFEDVKHKLEIRSALDGSFLQKIPPEMGIVSEYFIHKENYEFYFKFENLVTPGRIYRCYYQGTSEVLACEIFREIELSVKDIDLNSFTMSQVFFPSKDGTRIPMFVAHKKDLVLDGNAPALAFAYGGFNVDVLPSFSPFSLAFINYFNGVYASANIRGGAEYGEKWHEGGMLLQKQNSFDDFQAAAEYLIQNKYTSSPKLAIQGSSNGGLLIGACANQRPDLFGIALPDVGLLDMLRFQKSSIGFAWCSEYGCSDNKTHFENLIKYSPLHNIRQLENEQQLPATLVTTADRDDRVLPSHSFKYISELQYTIGNDPTQKYPLLLHVEPDAGHGDKPTLKMISGYTDAFAFITEKLRVDEEENLQGAASSISSYTILVGNLVLCSHIL